MKKVSGGLLCLFVMCSTSLFAQDSRHVPRAVHTVEKSPTHMRAVPHPTPTRFSSTRGPPANAYNDAFGFLVAGPGSEFGQEFIGLAFTPKADSTVTVIQAALLFLDQGNGAPNQINVSLYSDAVGVPGSIISGPHTVKNLADAGTCCALATWHLSQ